MSSPAPALALDRAESSRPVVPAFLLFSCAHFLIDMYSIALGVLRPLLLARFGLNLTQAGILGGVLVFSSSMMQPVYGYLSDRFHTYLFTALAPALTAILISSLGLASGYWTLLAMVWLGGAGIASFHPQATANATRGINAHRGRALAAFISAGTLGLSIGPAYFSWMTSTLGISRTYWAALPGVAMTGLLLASLKLSPPADSQMKLSFDLAPLRAVRRPLTILFLLVVIRSIVQITFAQFLPLYLKLQRGYSLLVASYITSFYLLAGALGGFTGGNLANRFGGRRVILFSMLCSVPFLLLFVSTRGPLSVAGLIIGGVILLFTIPVNVMMGQALAPENGGTVSALMMGAAWGVAGIFFIPLTGWVSDHYSLQHAFAGLVVVPIAGYLLALKLPK
jgi:FSR family fosmidomycin resistance protein-like MFS transporter